MQIQQGDVTFETVEKLPEGLKKLESRDGKYILAEGEQSNHHHSILADSADVFVAEDGTLYASVREDVQVDHQEHSAVVLQPNVWRVGRVLTKDWTTRLARKVVD